VEIAAVGASLTWAIDGRPICRDARLPAVGRGRVTLEAWPGKAGDTFEIRKVFAAVLDRQVDSGVAEGIVTDKGPDWIALKEDGEDVPLRYVPQKGAGGGFDAEMLKTIKGIITLNRARYSWKLDRGRLQVIQIQILKPGRQAGVIIGTITFKHGSCIEVKPAGAPPERLIPRWQGGMPSQGGGPEKKIVKALAPFVVGDKVKVDWVYDDRKRVVGVARVK
jgi:hypothetical protein